MQRFSDWEADTVLSKQGRGAIVSLAERKSELYLIRKVRAKSTADVARATVAYCRNIEVMFVLSRQTTAANSVTKNVSRLQATCCVRYSMNHATLPILGVVPFGV